jgi:hypothetical protein
MEQKIWWYALNNEQKGPVSESELNLLQNHNVLSSDTLVWKDGLQNWIKYSERNQHQKSTPPIPLNSYQQSNHTIISTANPINLVNLDPYYQEEFKKITSSNETYKGKWNWWAFLFSWVWCFTKGLWAYALLLFIPYLILIVTSFPLSQIYALVWLIILGLKGTWFYYNLKLKGKQM